MTKLKNPLMSLKATGGLGKLFSLVKRRGQNIIEKRPVPTDARSPAQLFNRHMFSKCVDLWHTLSEAEHQVWESLARPLHMTGYAWYISQCLRPNPGIYLPLQGGTMSGDIDMATHRVLVLPDPLVNQEPVTKKYFEDNLPAVAADYPMKLKPSLTRYVLPGWSINDYTTYSVTENLIFYIPIFVTETTTYIRICVQITTAAPGAADLRIFNWSNGLPDSLILNAGTVDTGTTGPKEITISQELTRGYYFLTIRLSEPGVSLRGPTRAFILTSPVAGLNTVSAIRNYPIPYVTAAYADPAPAPTNIAAASFATVYLREN